MKNSYTFSNKVTVKAPKELCTDLMRELWDGFCYTASEAAFVPSNGCEMIIGTPDPKGKTNGASAIETVKELNAYGFMETTRHHLPKMMPMLLFAIQNLNVTKPSDLNVRTETATLIRKLAPASSYKEAGWARLQLEFI